MISPTELNKLVGELVKTVSDLQESKQGLEERMIQLEYNNWYAQPLFKKASRESAISLCAVACSKPEKYADLIKQLDLAPPDFQRMVKIYTRQRREEDVANLIGIFMMCPNAPSQNLFDLWKQLHYEIANDTFNQ